MNFTVYSKDGCPYCTKVVQVLELAKLNHVVYKLDEHFDRDAFYGQFGEGSTFPQVVIDSTNLGGCTETVQYLKEKKISLMKKVDDFETVYDMIEHALELAFDGKMQLKIL